MPLIEDMQQLDELTDEIKLAFRALAGLRELYVYIEPYEPDGGPSAADTCAALYELMCGLGMPVP